MRYQFIREHRAEFSVKRMCQLLGVTRSGYYAWQPEKAGPRELENRVLVEQIRVEYKISRQTYGSPRIWAASARTGMCLWTSSRGTLDAQRRHSPTKTTQTVSGDHAASAQV